MSIGLASSSLSELLDEEDEDELIEALRSLSLMVPESTLFTVMSSFGEEMGSIDTAFGSSASELLDDEDETF